MSVDPYINKTPLLRALRIALLYAIFSIFWILFSDKALLLLITDIEKLTFFQTIKGWCFVALSAGIIFVFLHREIKGHIGTKERFQAIFDHHYQLTGLLTPEGVLISANPAALRFVGAKEENVLGKYFWETPWWSHSEELQKKIKSGISTAADGNFVRFETTHPGRDGEIKYVDFSINPVTNENGEIIYLVPEGRDISPMKEIENALLESQTLYKEAQEIAHIGHWKYDFIEKRLEWSDELFRIFDISKEEFNDSLELFKNLIHPDEREWVLDKFERSIKNREHFKLEHRVLLPQGIIKHVLVQGRTEFLHSGAPLIFIGTAQDVTEKKEAEERLLFTQHSVDEGSTPIIWMDGEQMILYANNAACNLLQYSEGELREAKGDLLYPDEAIAYWNKYTPIIREKRSASDEVELKRKDGSLISVFFTCSLVEYMGKAYFVFHLYDLTDLKRTEEKLRQAQKLEAIGTLAGGIAHDFNNILSGVIGYTEIALDDELPVDSPARRSLNQVLIAAYRARDLVKQILTFSRQSASQKAILDLIPIVEEVLRLMRASLPANIEIRHEFHGEKFEIIGDPTHVHQILTNLCTNAGYAIRKEGGVLSILLRTVEYNFSESEILKNISPGKYVKLTVEDTGPGIDKAIIEKIFNPFFTTKPKEEGTGLGLSVVHGIVKEHGGDISVDSKPGKGTSFTVHFPQIAISSVADHQTEKTLPRGSETILFVDDEEAIVATYSTTLEKLGYRVISTTRSEEALTLFSSDPEKFDLIVSDQTMPVMTGDQLVREALIIRRDIPIILCTGFSHTMDADEAQVLGARKLLMKPTSKQDLANSVREVLDQNN